MYSMYIYIFLGYGDSNHYNYRLKRQLAIVFTNRLYTDGIRDRSECITGKYFKFLRCSYGNIFLII